MHAVEAHGAKIPAVGLGTWTLEGRHCTDLVRAAIETGYRHIDTAAAYGNEHEVGRGVRASGADRASLFITTKVWWTDIADGDLQRSAEESVDRLGLDAVDLLLIHWPNPRITVEESIRALNDAKKRGLARHIGVSNFPTALLEEATRFSEAPLVCDQVEYHPCLGQKKVKAFCDSHAMAMVSYCPLFRGGRLFGEKAVREAAKRHGRTPAQIILRWHVQQPGVACIPRTRRPERLAENISIFDFELSGEEMNAVSALAVKNIRICDFGFSPEWDEA